MRSAHQPLYPDPIHSFHQKPHKDMTSGNILFHQAHSPKVISQVIYQPIELHKKLAQPFIPPPPDPTTNNIQQLLERIKRHEQQQVTLKAKLEVLEQEKRILSVQLQEYRRKSASSHQDSSLVVMLNQLQKQKEQLIECNKQYQEQLKFLLMKLEALDVDELNREKQNLGKEIMALKLGHTKKVESLQEEVEELIVELEGRNARERELQLAVDNMMVENRMLNKYLKVKEGEIVDNNEMKKSCEDRIKKLERVVEELAKVKEGMDALNQVREEYRQLNMCLSATREIVSQKDEELKFLREEIQCYKESIREIISEKNDLSETIKELTRVIEIEKHRNSVRQDKKNNKGKFKEEFQNRLKELVNELSKLKMKISEDAKLYQQEIRAISEKKEESEIEIASLSTTLTMKSLEVNDKYRIIEDLEGELGEVKQENNKLRGELGRVRTEYERTKMELKVRTTEFGDALRRIRHEYEGSVKEKLKPYVLKVQSLEMELQKEKGESIIRSLNNSRSCDCPSKQQSRLNSLTPSNIQSESMQDRLKLNQLKSEFYKEKTNHLQKQVQHSLNTNKQLKQIIQKLGGQVEYLRSQLKNSLLVQSDLMNAEQKNAQSIEEINSLKNDLMKTSKVSLHRQSSLTTTISDLKEQLALKDCKIKELNGKISLSETQIDSLRKQLEISTRHVALLSSQKYQMQAKTQSLERAFNEGGQQVHEYKVNAETLEQSNTQLCQTISKLKIQLHLKTIELTESKQELDLLRCVNKGLNDRIDVLSDQLIASSSNRMREIMQMHSNVQTMVASLQMFHSKDCSFD